MGIHVAIEHRTLYTFDRTVQIAPHVIRLRPAPHCRTPILSYSLAVKPRNHWVNWQQDPFGNHQARLVFPDKATTLSLTVDIVADMAVINPFDFFVEPSAERYPFTYDRGLARDLAPYLAVEPAGPLLADWLRPERTRPAGGDPRTVDFLVRVNQRLRDDVAYTTRMEPGVQTAEETLEKRLGSCRDTGWLLVQILRHLGLAARFVSGYLVQLAPDSEPLDGPAGPSEDFTDLHAWAEVYVPGAGWIGLDPTSGLLAGEGHIPLACTPEPSSVAPVTGAVDPCETTLDFANVVSRIHETPRATWPYTEEQWASVLALGHAVDEELVRGDVRLTMGGEPTYVAVDDADAPEWTTAADGPAKRRRAAELARNLAERFAPDGLLQHGQGKWYPGEPLPRWQIGVLWRADGEPLWARRQLLADPWSTGSAGAAEAAVVAHALTSALRLPAERCLPAYEDALLRLWREAVLPQGAPPARPAAGSGEIDPDPTDPSLADAERRARLRDQLDAHTGDPAGYVLPLHRPAGSDAWVTAEWTLRRQRLFLVEGDSPLGLRLPIPSLSWQPPLADTERSRFEPRGPLRPPEELTGAAAIGSVVPVGDVPPTALCVEVRNGQVHVFLPPLSHLDHAVELIALVERVASELDQPVVLEGYPLPEDPRLRRIVVTPDPGVIEVNVQPASSWSELVDIAESLDDDARAARLTTERFDLDGTATGTGGGSHLTLGGPTPADSPLLRRPDLLRSLVTFWQHHPSLSYLFSGRFIGPTSQAPRVDEGRPEALHELEIAFGELDRHVGGTAPYWIVDRLLRNLLIDVTGNTHRAEFCVDKLYSPDSERGRSGIVELRGFEMQPHPRLALTQALLVRALVSRFWDEPYQGRLVRWGTELHDRFMLPWFVEADAGDVVDDLRHHGRPFSTDWLSPFFDLRFPRLGRVDVAGASLELRGAIEPWHVLGEEATAGGTARYVDSSVERLQVRVDGMVEGRHVLTCNGTVVPLAATGTVGTFVAGVRYRAWAPPSSLHPTIGIDAPLVFDLVDRWNERSLGGCAYHVIHPGGRGYDIAPVNANEAEARRRSRFSALGHTGGRLDPSRLPTDRQRAPDQPVTLDLRRAGRVV